MESRGKTHTTTVAWVPRDPLWSQIQSIRERHDKQFYRWPPHINIAYPFVPPEDFAGAAAALAHELRDVQPFNLRFHTLGYFEHGRSCTSWLLPEYDSDSHSEGLQLLHQACVSAVPHCNDLSANFGNQFRPHLTLGQFGNKRQVQQFVDTTQASWDTQLELCDHVCLLSRDGPEAPFIIRYRVYLGTGSFEPCAEITAQVVPSRPMVVAGAKRRVDKTESVEKEDFLSPERCIDVDGSVLEGGGQILRMALALSVVSQTPVRIHSIRAGRATPGLRPQHLGCVRLLSHICDARVSGDAVSSTEITIIPSRVKDGSHDYDTGTAGSLSLLLQASLPCTLCLDPGKELKLRLRGGTNVSFSPPIDHLIHVLAPLLMRMGLQISVNRVERGYYPTGGGLVHLSAMLTLEPGQQLHPIHLMEQGTVSRIRFCVFGGGPCTQTGKIETLQRYAREQLEKSFPGQDVSIDDITIPDVRRGSRAKHSALGIQVCAHTSTGAILSGNRLLEFKGSDLPEQDALAVVDSALEELHLVHASGACVDEHTADQLIVYMAHASSSSQILVAPETPRSSKHLETALYTAALLSRSSFNCEVVNNGCRLVTCTPSLTSDVCDEDVSH